MSESDTRDSATVLDLSTMALHGMALIEANAGTGKTFTITKLFLRILLEKRLPVDQICVATFTEAAAAELLGRIRETLDLAHELARGGDGASSEPAERSVIRALLERALESESRVAIAARLRQAIIHFDRAAIGTIHGICARWSREFAFSAALDFEPGAIETGESLLREAQSNLWQRILESDPRAAELLLSQCPDLGSFRRRTQLERVPARRTGKAARPLDASDSAVARLATMRTAFVTTHAKTLVERNGGYAGWNGGHALGKLMKAGGGDFITELLDYVDAVFHQRADVQRPNWADTLTATDTSIWLRKNVKPLPDPGAMLAAANLVREADRVRLICDQAAMSLVDDLRLEVRQIFARLKRERRITTFDDLIDDLRLGLERSPGLGRAIVAAYPCALIDEFQDTSAVESSIFTDIYGTDGLLVMVGDPKQAIYAFKGGDVHAYLKVASRTDVARYRLAVCYRATANFVAAVNHLFRAERNPFLDQRLQYQPVAAQRSDRDDAHGLHLVAVPIDGRPGNPSGVGVVTEAAIRVVGKLLEQGITPGDIAVLARTNRDVEDLRVALSDAGIAAASTGQTSVFETPEARDLLRLAKCLENPGDEAALRAALVGPLHNRTFDEVIALAQDERAWRAVLDHFAKLREIWELGGLISAAYRLLTDAAPRLLASPRGDRSLTNYLHLLEMAQAAESRQLGLRAVIQWLADRIDDPDRSNFDEQIRIESDHRAVRVMTVHASKGLEFEHVVLPNLWAGAGRPRPKAADLAASRSPIEYFSNDQRCVDVGSAERMEAATSALMEEMSEDLRLAYVAITRAKRGCQVLVPRLNRGVNRHGAAWLLGPDDWRVLPPDPGATMPTDVASWLRHGLGDTNAIAVVGPPPQASHHEGGGDHTRRETASRIPPVVPGDPWAITSFSRLRRDHQVSELARDTLVDESEASTDDAAFDQSDAVLPGGAAFGNAFHHIMERLGFGTGAASAQGLIKESLRRYGIVPADATMIAVKDLVQRTLDAKLDDRGLSLKALDPGAVVAEMEFFFHLGDARREKLRGLLREHPWSARHCPDAFDIEGRAPLRGQVNGLIDLVFNWRDRLFLLDYKTNRLGEHPRDYSVANMERAMHEAQYTLQYLLYAVALRRHAEGIHRGGFDDHFGGVYYLFVRGLDGTPSHGIYHVAPPAELIRALDELLGGRL